MAAGPRAGACRLRRFWGGDRRSPKGILKGLGRLSSKCNSLEEDIERRAPVESLARPVVDQIKDALKLRLCYVQKVTTGSIPNSV